VPYLIPITDRIRLEDEGNACPTKGFKTMKIKMKTQKCSKDANGYGEDRKDREDEGNACPTRGFKAMKIKMKTQKCPKMAMAIQCKRRNC